MSSSPHFLSLPREIRDEIYRYLVVKPTNTITMLENHNCFQNEISAAQPAISRVNKQVRAEALPMFYQSNLFLAELSNALDLHTAKGWLSAIGDLNVGYLRQVDARGWTKVAFGHRMCRLSIRVIFHLKDGSLEIEGNEAAADGHRHLFKDMKPMEDGYKALVHAVHAERRTFDVESLGRLMELFHGVCTEYCSKSRKDLDGECQRCGS